MIDFVSSPARRSWFDTIREWSTPGVLSLLSYLIYAFLALTLPQVVDNPFICERSSLAAAVSHVAFGMRFGTLDSEVLDYYVKALDEPLQGVLDDTSAAVLRYRGSPMPGSVMKTIRDGNGAGYLFVLVAAFRLFGLHFWALPAIMLALMGASALALRRRFSDWSASIVVLYFTVLTAIMFTPIVWTPIYALNAPIGGIRYFSLITILPTFHILLEFFDASGVRQERTKRLVYLGIQAAILVVGAMVRGSAIPLLGAVAVVWAMVVLRHRREAERRRSLLAQAMTVAIVGIVLIGAMVASLPREYLREGRFGTVIWHRVTLSLGVNPSFPWPGIADMFDCKEYIPEGIIATTPDTNGHCIWLDYVAKHHIPIETIDDKTYGGLYDTALREAFFAIARLYPKETLTTFVYYKPLRIVDALVASLRTNFRADPVRTVDYNIPVPQSNMVPYSPLTIVLLLVALGIGSLYFLVIPRLPLAAMRPVAGVALLGTAFTIPSYIAVWAQPATVTDLVFYLLFCAGLAVAGLLMSGRWVMYWLALPRATREA